MHATVPLSVLCAESMHSFYLCLCWRVNLAKPKDVEAMEGPTYNKFEEEDKAVDLLAQGESLVVSHVMISSKTEER